MILEDGVVGKSVSLMNTAFPLLSVVVRYRLRVRNSFCGDMACGGGRGGGRNCVLIVFLGSGSPISFLQKIVMLNDNLETLSVIVRLVHLCFQAGLSGRHY